MLFFVTAVAGRLRCGYTCPQTVCTEIFMWVERKTEGDRIARMRRGWASAWNSFWILFYGAATYGNAGYLREQICKYMCPYARFQSALIDKDSLVITYDSGRGDPRGSRSRKASPAAQGLGACIDVCNGVMDKMGYPQGLIRYATENGVVNGWSRRQMFKRALRPRVLVYGGLLLAASIGFTASVAMRSPFTFDVVRDRGALGRVVDDGAVENVYRIHGINRTELRHPYRITTRASAVQREQSTFFVPR